MDIAKREALIERRRLAQLRRQRAETSASFRRVAPQLCAAGARFSKVMPCRIEALLGPLIAGPGRDEELDFGAIPNAQTSIWSGASQRDSLCRWALAAVAREEEPVAVIWHPARAGIRVPVAVLRTHTRLLLDEGDGGTTWIARADRGPWLIQVGFWSRTVSYAPNIPVHGDRG